MNNQHLMMGRLVHVIGEWLMHVTNSVSRSVFNTYLGCIEGRESQYCDPYSCRGRESVMITPKLH